MTQILLFLGFSLLPMIALIMINWYKKIDFKTLVGLFLFGIFISIPFILIEYLGIHLKFYIVILAFIGIELSVIYFENRIKYFHDLIHHNIKELRIISFVLIGLGFTFSEISFTIFHLNGSFAEMMNILPLKTVYALLIHTVLSSAGSLAHIGNFFSETIFETIFKLVSYYLRITVISISHYFYSFSVEHNLLYLTTIILMIGMVTFFYIKKALDSKVLVRRLE